VDKDIEQNDSHLKDKTLSGMTAEGHTEKGLTAG
jgi:hypothetical protein